MPLEWPPNIPEPRRPRKNRGLSGKGSGTTVGLSIAIFGSAAVVILGAFGYVLFERFVA